MQRKHFLIPQGLSVAALLTAFTLPATQVVADKAAEHAATMTC
jgi:hypothetical protein